MLAPSKLTFASVTGATASAPSAPIISQGLLNTSSLPGTFTFLGTFKPPVNPPTGTTGTAPAPFTPTSVGPLDATPSIPLTQPTLPTSTSAGTDSGTSGGTSGTTSTSGGDYRDVADALGSLFQGILGGNAPSAPAQPTTIYTPAPNVTNTGFSPIVLVLVAGLAGVGVWLVVRHHNKGAA